MKEYKQADFSGERALFGQQDLRVVDCVFDAGESPLKECRDLELQVPSLKSAVATPVFLMMPSLSCSDSSTSLFPI